jgi:simple sugar transport system substrate-binding protein
MRTVLKIVGAAALATVSLGAMVSAASADALRDKWCDGVTVRFFAGGAEGDAFASIVYNGAKQAEHDLGVKVDYIFSGWSSEKMVQQLREAVAAAPGTRRAVPSARRQSVASG